MLLVWLAQSAIAADIEALHRALLEDPAGTATALRDPEGPLAAAFPTTRASVAGAPVYVLEATLDGSLGFDLVSAWTNPTSERVRTLVFHWPAEAFGASVALLEVDGGRAVSLEEGLAVRLDRAVRPGETAAVRLRGVVVPAVLTERQWRLGWIEDGQVFGAWLPVLAHHDGIDWPIPSLPSTGDPYSTDAAVFAARVRVLEDDPLQVVHAGARLRAEPGLVDLAVVGARELPLAFLGASWGRTEVPGSPTLELYARGPAEPRDTRAAAMRRELDWLTSSLGPLSHERLVAIASTPPGKGTELPGLMLVQADDDDRSCQIDAHELAHQWWYGEVGSSTRLEPWIDESLATWSAFQACRATGQPFSLDTHVEAWSKVDKPTSASASELGEHWALVYIRGPGFWRDLDGPQLSQTLAAVVREHRWGWLTGDVLLERLRDDLSAPAVDGAWQRWMETPP